MKREIKFRAFHKGKWYYSDSQEDAILLGARLGESCIGILMHWFYGDETLSQYTGLKDKNGVEIYEGDVLMCHQYDSSDCGHRIVQTFNNAVVGFYQGNYYYYPKGNMNQPHELLMYAHKREVIGNIYENTELLK